MGLFKRDSGVQRQSVGSSMPFTTWVVEESEYSPSDPVHVRGHGSMSAAIAECVGYYRAHLERCDDEWDRDWRRLRVCEGSAVVCHVLSNSLSDGNLRRMANTKANGWLMYRCGKPVGSYGEAGEPLVVFDAAWARANESSLVEWTRSEAEARFAPSEVYAEKRVGRDVYVPHNCYFWCKNADPLTPTKEPQHQATASRPKKAKQADAPMPRWTTTLPPKTKQPEDAMRNTLVRLNVLVTSPDGSESTDLQQLGATHTVTCKAVEDAWADRQSFSALSLQQQLDLQLCTTSLQAAALRTAEQFQERGDELNRDFAAMLLRGCYASAMVDAMVGVPYSPVFCDWLRTIVPGIDVQLAEKVKRAVGGETE